MPGLRFINLTHSTSVYCGEGGAWNSLTNRGKAESKPHHQNGSKPPAFIRGGDLPLFRRGWKVLTESSPTPARLRSSFQGIPSANSSLPSCGDNLTSASWAIKHFNKTPADLLILLGQPAEKSSTMR